MADNLLYILVIVFSLTLKPAFKCGECVLFYPSSIESLHGSKTENTSIRAIHPSFYCDLLTLYVVRIFVELFFAHMRERQIEKNLSLHRKISSESYKNSCQFTP